MCFIWCQLLLCSPHFSCPSHRSTGTHDFPFLSSSLHPSILRSTGRVRTPDIAVAQQVTHPKTLGKEREVRKHAGHGYSVNVLSVVVGLIEDRWWSLQHTFRSKADRRVTWHLVMWESVKGYKSRLTMKRHWHQCANLCQRFQNFYVWQFIHYIYHFNWLSITFSYFNCKPTCSTDRLISGLVLR